MQVLHIGANSQLSVLVARGLSKKGFSVQVMPFAEMIKSFDEPTFVAATLDLEDHHVRRRSSIQKIKHLCGPIPILALGGTTPELRVKVLKSGVDECLSEPISISELIEHLRILLRNAAPARDSTIRVNGLALDIPSGEIEVRGKHHVLRCREATILALLMDNPNRIVPKQRLEIELYGASTKDTSNAVDVGIHRLRRSLARSGSDVTIETTRNVGYVLWESVR